MSMMEKLMKKIQVGDERTSPAVQWFKHYTSTARGMGLKPGW